MKMEPIESSNIKAVGYDPETTTLRVEFHNGRSADYGNVAPETYTAFMAAPSKGGHFHKHIRSCHLCNPVSQES